MLRIVSSLCSGLLLLSVSPASAADSLMPDESGFAAYQDSCSYQALYYSDYILNPCFTYSGKLPEVGELSSYALSFDAQSDEFSDTPLPLHLSASPEKDWQYLKEQTYTILGLSIATVGFMTLLPESITKWDDEDKSFSNLGQKWKRNVKAGPVWDEDEHYLNYIMHPYFGGVYYTASRHAGFSEFESFLYSWTMSTFFWEYGVEAFAEVPSWQDLFVTPFFGAMVGEMMFEAEKDILANGGEVMGSDTMGSVSLFLLNPVGHIHYWVTDAWGGSADFTFSSNTWFGNKEAATFALDAGAPYDHQFIGGQLSLRF